MRAKAAVDEGRSQTKRLGLPRTIATGFALLFIAFGLWGFWTNLLKAAGVDFISFWAAGRLTLAGHASAAYDIALHRKIEQAIVPHVGLLPFPYPPPFLIIVTPFALLPFTWAFVAWVVITGSIYAWSSKRFAPLSFAFANPPALVDFMIGQTGFLTTGLFLFGLGLLSSAPFTAGAILGLLLVKPQLALLLPVAMLGGREWRAIAGAVMSSVGALLTGVFFFGIDAYRGFLEILPHYTGYMRHNSWNWVELASPFAFLRYININPAAALVAQSVIAAGATLVTYFAWSRRWPEKFAILAAASLLMSPYLLTYDTLLLIVPAAYFLELRRWWTVGLLWLLCALPVAHFFKLYEGPNTIPLAGLASVGLLTAPHFASALNRSVHRTLPE
jgi:alpha-1,2-mannosyltransferase